MILDDIGIILLENPRSRAYIQALFNSNILPSFAIILNKTKMTNCDLKYNKEKYFDINLECEKTIKKAKIPFLILDSDSCNDDIVLESLKKRKEKNFIYSGGGILGKDILGIKKKFIHVHPGIVPFYKGSTCFYYSIINEGYIGATSFFMEENLDTGDIIFQKKFNLQDDEIDPDYILEPYLRSLVLVESLSNYAKNKKFKTKKQDKDSGETYFIIHPVLKHLALLKIKGEKK